jgi:hypothetical protein
LGPGIDRTYVFVLVVRRVFRFWAGFVVRVEFREWDCRPVALFAARELFGATDEVREPLSERFCVPLTAVFESFDAFGFTAGFATGFGF